MTEADRRFRKNVIAAAMLLGPLLILIGILISSPIYSGDDETRYLASIAEHRDAHWIGNVVSAAGALMLPLAMLGAVHLVRVRKRIFGTVAGVVALIGAFGIGGAWLVISLIDYVLALQPERAAMVALQKEMESQAMVPLIFIWGGFVIGMLLVGIGLLLARTVPRWTAILFLVAVAGFFVSADGASEIIANVLLVAAWGSVAWSVWKRTPDEWERGDLPAETRQQPEPAPAAA